MVNYSDWKIELVATDVDHTITNGAGLVDGRTIEAFERLAEAGVKVALVSGKPLATVLALARYLLPPGTAAGAGGENGAVCQVLMPGEERAPEVSAEKPPLVEIGADNEVVPAEKFFGLFPGGGFEGHGLVLKGDNRLRYSTVAVSRKDSAGRTIMPGAIERMRGVVREAGLDLNYSSINIHFFTPGDIADKGDAAARIAREHGIDEANVLAVGDSPNDAALFRRFAHRAAPGNIRENLELLSAPPYGVEHSPENFLVSGEEYNAGFLDIVKTIFPERLASRG